MANLKTQGQNQQVSACQLGMHLAKQVGAVDFRYFFVSQAMRKKYFMPNGNKKDIFWAKVLPEQWELLQIFMKHEIS